MVKQNVRAQELDAKDISISEYEVKNLRQVISEYFDRINSAEIEKIKFYLGYVYFGALMLISLSLFL